MHLEPRHEEIRMLLGPKSAKSTISINSLLGGLAEENVLDPKP